MTPSAKLLNLTAGSFVALCLASCSSRTSSMPSAPSAPSMPTIPANATIPDVTTYHYNLNRDGLNSQEAILTQANVNSTNFGKIGMDSVDGKVDAEPLYLGNLTIAGASHNVLFVATEHGSVFAFDADTNTQLWKTSVIPTGETTSDDHGCSQITTEIGITSTPVIDRKQGPNGTLFTVGMSKDAGGNYHQRFHALDITTGTEIAGSPTEITASVPGAGDNSQGGNIVFDPSQYAERAALTLYNGNIYTAWTSHCDRALYTGWVMAYKETTLQQTQLINLIPNGHGGSVWMSGGGLAVDSAGSLYLADANGTFDATLDANGNPSNHDYGNAMIRLTANGSLVVADYFNVSNTVAESAQDLDLGSGGVVLLPDMTDASGKVQHLIVGAGKDKNIYIASRDSLGTFNANSPTNANVYQQITGQLAGLNYTTPAFFNGVLYYASDGDALKAFPFTNATMATAPTSVSTATFAHPGSTPAVSANGTQNGIVWAVESALAAPAVLHAYDPANLQHEFYNSNQAAGGRDAFGNGNKFITPLVVNGKVYIGTQTGVAIFGLLSQ
jgi:hypothetical protein